MECKENFINWMTNRLAEGTITIYSSKIDKLSNDLKSKSLLSVDSLYQLKNPSELESIYKEWYEVPEFRQNDETSHKQESNAFKRYIEFRSYEEKLGLNNEKGLFSAITPSESESFKESYIFAFEEHLQDFLISNLSTIKKHKLKLFEDGVRRGKEFPTAVGPIDILTKDERGDFYVFETKLSKGMDKALGQLLRYMGWVKVELAKGKNVFGIIVAHKMDEKIKYAVEMTPNVSLCEYEMNFKINFLDKKKG